MLQEVERYQKQIHLRILGVPSRVRFKKKKKKQMSLLTAGFQSYFLLMSRNYVNVANEKYVLDQWEGFYHRQVI